MKNWTQNKFLHSISFYVGISTTLFVIISYYRLIIPPNQITRVILRLLDFSLIFIMFASVLGAIIFIFAGILAIVSEYSLKPIHIAGPCVLFTLFLFMLTPSWPKPLPYGSHNLKFNQALWNEPDSAKSDQNLTPRQQMLRHLVTEVLPRKNEKEIIELSGPLDEELNKRYYYPDENRKTFSFELGHDRWHIQRKGFEILRINFDLSGNYVNYSFGPTD